MTSRKFILGAYSLRGREPHKIKIYMLMGGSYFGMVTGNYCRFDNKKLSENLIQKTANFASSKIFSLEASSSNMDF